MKIAEIVSITKIISKDVSEKYSVMSILVKSDYELSENTDEFETDIIIYPETKTYIAVESSHPNNKYNTIPASTFISANTPS